MNCCYLPRTPQSVRASIRPSVMSSEFRSAAAIQRASAASSPGRNVPPVTPPEKGRYTRPTSMTRQAALPAERDKRGTVLLT